VRNRKGSKDYFEMIEGDETRRQCLIAFWDFCRDCFGDEQETPLPGDEISFQLPHPYRSPDLRKLPL